MCILEYTIKPIGFTEDKSLDDKTSDPIAPFFQPSSCRHRSCLWVSETFSGRGIAQHRPVILGTHGPSGIDMNDINCRTGKGDE